MLNKAIRSYIGFQMSITLLFWVPIFYTYQKQIGLSDQDYFSIQSYYHWLFIFLEIPTGFIADRWGHRTSLKLAAFFMLLSNLLAIYWVSYTGFFCQFSMIALGRSLMSGASSAYLFDLLKKNEKSELYKKIEGQARSYSLFTRIAAWGVAGFLFEKQATLPYWLTVVSCSVAFYYAFALPKTQLPKKRTVKSSLKEAFAELVQNRVLQAALFLGVGSFVLVRFTQVVFYQPLLENQGFSASSFGWILALMTCFEAISSMKTHRLEKLFSDQKAIIFTTVTMALSLVSITYANKVMTVVFFIIFALASGFTLPLIRQQLNLSIQNDHQRATLLSVESIVQRVFMGITTMAAGYYVSAGQMNGFLQSIAGLSLIVVAFSSFALSKSQKA